LDTRLKSKKVIDKLFKDGKSAFSFPIKMVYLLSNDKSGEYGTQSGVSVSKRQFKRAVDRNLIKRRIREAVRLSVSQTEHTNDYLAVMYIYVAKDILEYNAIAHGVKRVNKSLP
jgi:ribonuclease P protein component